MSKRKMPPEKGPPWIKMTQCQTGPKEEEGEGQNEAFDRE